MIDLELFRKILSIDSTSGKEAELGEFLYNTLEAPEKEKLPEGNLFFKWGTPRVVFCSHMDTVPPYIPPVFEADRVLGRGSCDAKGQVLCLYTACRQLEAAGKSGFGLLVLTGEETGSWGAKAFSKTGFQAPYLIVGEPTENKMVSASKGTKSYDLTFHGKAFHSGYPEYGESAVDLFLDFMKRLRMMDFGNDPLLGKTTWNVGMLRSDNPQNILSPELTCRLYFRTTFSSDRAVELFMQQSASAKIEVVARGGDTPARYFVPDGFEAAPASFGTDAPHLSAFAHKSICGPGTVKVAHRPDEHILLQDMETAVELYIRYFNSIQ